MIKQKFIIVFIFLVCVPYLTGADLLPKQVPENQIYSIGTGIDATGIVSEESALDYTIDYQHIFLYYDNSTNESVYDEGYIHHGKLKRTESIAILEWQDDFHTNGGDVSLNKEYEYNSKNRRESLYNLKTDKVLTYNSKGGSHLNGNEKWVLDVAGNYNSSTLIVVILPDTGERYLSTELFPYSG